MQKYVRYFGVVVAIVIAVVACYVNSFDVPLTFDDQHNIEQNPNVQIQDLSLDSLRQVVSNNHTPRPVAYLSFAINYYFHGLEVWGYHLVSVVIHGLNGLLVFLLCCWLAPRLLTEVEKSERTIGWRVVWMALLAGILFVVHPIQTQSVSYVVQRMNILCVFFYLSGLLAWLVGRDSSGLGRIALWLASLVFWGLALGSKQLAVTLPLAIWLCEWILYRKGSREWLVAGCRYLTVIAFLFVGLFFLFKGFDGLSLFTRGYAKRDFSLVERLLTEGRVMIHYITLIILPMPARMSLIYDYPISTSLFSPISTLFSWATILAAIVWAIYNARQFPWISFCILWFFVHLAVESTVIPLELVYEHRLYLPMFAVCVAVANYALRLENDQWVFGVAALVVGLLVWGTHVRNETWRSEKTLWQDCVWKHPRESRAHYNLGAIYAKEGNYERALHHFQKTATLDPDLQLAWSWQGLIYELTGQIDTAVKFYKKAISLDDPESNELSGMQDALEGLGRIYYSRGGYLRASKLLNQAVDISTNRPTAFYWRAKTRVKLNKPSLAIQDYLSMLELAPESVDGHSHLAMLLATHPDDGVISPEQAIKHAKIACELTEWKSYLTMEALAAGYARAGDIENAVKWQTKLLTMAPAERKNALKARLKTYQSGQPWILAVDDIR